MLDGAPNHRFRHIDGSQQHLAAVPAVLAAELNPQENIWHEIREKMLQELRAQSMVAVHAKSIQAIL